jgi:hypothetical protein
MSKHFTALIGREVKFEQLTKPVPSKVRQLYGIYQVLPEDEPRVLQADLALLGSFGGALMGLPALSLKERLAPPIPEESLYDAILEVLNIASTVICANQRSVFQQAYMDPAFFPVEAIAVFRAPLVKAYFKVSVVDYEGGAFALFG